MRLIDADTLKERAIRVSTVKPPHTFFKAVGTREIDKAPTIDAKPVVHGEWRDIEVELEPEHGVVRKGTKEKRIECCECGWYMAGEKRNKTNYCPNCGAKMDGGKHER